MLPDCVHGNWEAALLDELVTRALYWACRLACAATTGDDFGEARGDEASGW